MDLSPRTNTDDDAGREVDRDVLGSPQGTPACPPQVIHLRCICPISSKPALIRGPDGFSSRREKRHK